MVTGIYPSDLKHVSSSRLSISIMGITSPELRLRFNHKANLFRFSDSTLNKVNAVSGDRARSPKVST